MTGLSSLATRASVQGVGVPLPNSGWIMRPSMSIICVALAFFSNRCGAHRWKAMVRQDDGVFWSFDFQVRDRNVTLSMVGS